MKLLVNIKGIKDKICGFCYFCWIGQKTARECMLFNIGLEKDNLNRPVRCTQCLNAQKKAKGAAMIEPYSDEEIADESGLWAQIEGYIACCCCDVDKKIDNMKVAFDRFIATVRARDATIAELKRLLGESAPYVDITLHNFRGTFGNDHHSVTDAETLIYNIRKAIEVRGKE